MLERFRPHRYNMHQLCKYAGAGLLTLSSLSCGVGLLLHDKGNSLVEEAAATVEDNKIDSLRAQVLDLRADQARLEAQTKSQSSTPTEQADDQANANNTSQKLLDQASDVYARMNGRQMTADQLIDTSQTVQNWRNKAALITIFGLTGFTGSLLLNKKYFALPAPPSVMPADVETIIETYGWPPSESDQ